MDKIGGNFEHGYESEDSRLTNVYRYISDLILQGKLEIGYDGNTPDDPDMGDFAELNPQNQPPEIEGAEAILPLSSKTAQAVGGYAIRGH